MEIPTIEARLALLEKAVAELKRQVSPGEETGDWLDDVFGCMDDEPDFQKIVQLGREIRHADRPQEPS